MFLNTQNDKYKHVHSLWLKIFIILCIKYSGTTELFIDSISSRLVKMFFINGNRSVGGVCLAFKLIYAKPILAGVLLHKLHNLSCYIFVSFV